MSTIGSGAPPPSIPSTPSAAEPGAASLDSVGGNSTATDGGGSGGQSGFSNESGFSKGGGGKSATVTALPSGDSFTGKTVAFDPNAYFDAATLPANPDANTAVSKANDLGACVQADIKQLPLLRMAVTSKQAVLDSVQNNIKKLQADNKDGKNDDQIAKLQGQVPGLQNDLQTAQNNVTVVEQQLTQFMQEDQQNFSNMLDKQMDKLSQGGDKSDDPKGAKAQLSSGQQYLQKLRQQIETMQPPIAGLATAARQQGSDNSGGSSDEGGGLDMGGGAGV